MEWIDREEVFPDCDKILCFGNGDVFICEILETKWGNYYYSKDTSNYKEWTHWLPIPESPKFDSPIQG